MCDLAKYSDKVLEARNIENNFVTKWLYHNEAIQVSCLDGYKYRKGAKLSTKTFVCADGELDVGECTSEY